MCKGTLFGNENVVTDSGFVLLFHHLEQARLDEIVLGGPVQNQVVLGLLEVPLALCLEFL